MVVVIDSGALLISEYKRFLLKRFDIFLFTFSKFCLYYLSSFSLLLFFFIYFYIFFFFLDIEIFLVLDKL